MKSKIKFAITVLMTLPLLSGCGTILSNDGVALIMPDVVAYSPAFQDRMADEIERGSCPALNEAIKDYSVMRDQARVGRK